MDTRSIVERITTPPKNGADAIFSRQLHPEAPIGGDAIVFPLEFGATTSYTFVQTVKAAQEKINAILKQENNFFMMQEDLHFSFASTIPISAQADYQVKKEAQKTEQLLQANKILHDFLNHTSPIKGKIFECIMKEDGHLLVRINIEPPTALLDVKEQLNATFGATYVRHPEHEARQILASVIAVVDYQQLSFDTKNKINEELRNLHTKLETLDSLQFLQVGWIHYCVRSLAMKYRLSEEIFQRIQTAEVHPASFRYPFFSIAHSAKNEIMNEEAIHPAALPRPSY